ncbi:MAG: cytochrome c [Paracoccaceae bacterium]
MKRHFVFAAVAALTAFGAMAQAAEEPFADAVETRHGLMLQMATDLGKMGAMAKGEAPYDAAIATKAAANVAAVASVISMDQFPAGSEVDKAADSFSLPELWANEADFLTKIAALNEASVAMQAVAGTDVEALKGGMAALGAACGGCHKVYRKPEE